MGQIWRRCFCYQWGATNRAIAGHDCVDDLVSEPEEKGVGAVDGAGVISSSLDIKKPKYNRACGKKAIWTKVKDEAGNEKFVYKRLYCKRWSCPECGPRMAWQLSKDIESAAGEKQLDRFLTLTLNPETIPEKDHPHRHIWNVWGKFRVYLGRKYNEPISYICVLELHRSGIPHLHALVDRYIHQKWISQAWEAVGGGPIVFIKRVERLADAEDISQST